MQYEISYPFSLNNFEAQPMGYGYPNWKWHGEIMENI
jgi:hypothetical protein